MIGKEPFNKPHLDALEKRSRELESQLIALRAENERLKAESIRRGDKMVEAASKIVDLRGRVAELEAALQEIAAVGNIVVDGLWEEFPALTRAEMFDKARQALAGKQP